MIWMVLESSSVSSIENENMLVLEFIIQILSSRHIYIFGNDIYTSRDAMRPWRNLVVLFILYFAFQNVNKLIVLYWNIIPHKNILLQNFSRCIISKNTCLIFIWYVSNTEWRGIEYVWNIWITHETYCLYIIFSNRKCICELHNKSVKIHEI